ncbi:putative peptide transporter ptr2 AltName: Full=Peptide permease ptr2 [Rhizoctonia solani AG-1 IB]|uniref:Peptide transporter ptr2 n=3 Tax=Rhizoctonia solani TaxID=456999 RepID=A0A8H3AYR8_9AGAM|nr:unnamed protein product [Rhizoctonia solani]CCO32902.1 putative peptide transporter ptr2 AltName: Full=Peptide permease ptr2 [Rhizoctonia solani AG-1 IB]
MSHQSNSPRPTDTVDPLHDPDPGHCIDVKPVIRLPNPIPAAAWVVIIFGSLERMAFYGGSIPFQNYIQRSGAVNDWPGRLGKGQITATALNQVFYFLSYLTPVAASLLCDQWFGKFTVIATSAIMGCIGWAIIAGTSVSSVPVDGGMTGLVVGMLLVAVSSGSVSSIVPAFAADQASHLIAQTVEYQNGYQVIRDPSLDVQHIFHWYYLYINGIGTIGSIATPFIEHYVSYLAVFLFAFGSMVAPSILIFTYKSRFALVPPTDNLIAYSWKAFATAYSERQYRRSKNIPLEPSFLDHAKESVLLNSVRSGIAPSEEPSTTSLSRGVPDGFVDDLSRAISTCRILPGLVVFWLAFNQCSHNLLSQAAQMRRPPWLSNDLMTNFNPIALTLFLPFVESVLFPWLRKKNIELLPMARISIGFALVAISMVYASVLQFYIYRSGPFFDHPGGRSNDISVWWQVPPYIIIALAEIFAVVTSLEYAYVRAPPSMKTIVSAMNVVPNAGSALLVYALLPLNRDPLLTWNFACIAILAGISTVWFYWFFRDEDTKWGKEMDSKREILKENYELVTRGGS